CAVSCVAGQAQEKPKADLNAPGEEHGKLDQLVGTWDVTVKFPVGPGREMEGQSSCEAKWTMDGRFLRQEYSSTFAGKPLTVVRYLGFDRRRGKFVEVQFESTHTDVLHSEGVLFPDGKTITCWGTHIDAATGKEMKVRTVTTLRDKDAFTLEMFYADAEGKDAKTITLTHK
ncbi:MAG: DUF1579 family protein, partial [Burkholderiales bacterium]